MSMHVEMNLFEDVRCAQSLHAVWRSVVPEGVRLGEALHRSGELRRMREGRISAADVINRLAFLVKRAFGNSRFEEECHSERPKGAKNLLVE